MKPTKNNKGFTLVEIIIVLVILGILASAFIPSALGHIERAKEAIDIENMQLAVKCAKYYILNKKFKENTTYYWDVETGDFVTEEPAIGYGKGTERDGGAIYYLYDNTERTIGGVISLELTDEGDFSMQWIEKG